MTVRRPESDMPFADLREYLSCLESHGELARVKKDVSLDYELGAVTYANVQSGGPALLFEHPIGCSVPVVVTILEDLQRYALAMETSLDCVHAEWTRRTSRPIAPRVVATGPCKENILLGDQADLFDFSVPTWNELDGGPYITLPIVITADPETGAVNAGMYRLQVHEPRRMGILAGPARHLAQHRRNWAKTEPFPVAIAVGTDP